MISELGREVEQAEAGMPTYETTGATGLSPVGIFGRKFGDVVDIPLILHARAGEPVKPRVVQTERPLLKET